MYYISLHIFISIFKKIVIKKMKINKIIKLKIDEEIENLKELENTLNTWNIAKWKYKRNENFNLPSTLKASMKLFDCFEVSHLTFCETGYSIDFENNEVKLTSLEKYKRISLKIFEENMEYLKKEIENGAKPTMITVIPPSYKRGKLHVNLKKDIELLTKEEFRKLQRIAVMGIDLNSRHGIGYAVWSWNRSNGLIKEEEIGFIKPKIKPHFFQEKVLRKLQRNHGDAVKYNELFQRITREFKDRIKIG